MANTESKGITMRYPEPSRAALPWDFFGLTFAFSWLVWLPPILANAGIIGVSVIGYSSQLALIGLFGPLFGACTLTYRREGLAGIGRLLSRLVAFRFDVAWWGAIFILPLGLQALSHFSPLLTGGPLPPSGTSSPLVFLSTFLMVTFLGGGQEEMGWRGYALDRIQARFNALTSSLILGTIWAFWHLPLWFMPGTSLSATPIGAFVLALLALSVILGWIYNNTNKSIAAPMLMHGMANASHALFPIFIPSGRSQPAYTNWAILCVIAATIIVVKWGPAKLTAPKA
jgi:hypothetical protein